MAIRARGSLDKHFPSAFQLRGPTKGHLYQLRPHLHASTSAQRPPSEDPLLPADWAAGCSASQQLPRSEVNPIQLLPESPHLVGWNYIPGPGLQVGVGAGDERWDIRVLEAREGGHPATSWAVGCRLPSPTPHFRTVSPGKPSARIRFTEEKTQGHGRAEQALGTLLRSRNGNLGRCRDRAGAALHPQVPRAAHRAGPQSVSQSANVQEATHPRHTRLAGVQSHPCGRKRAESHSNQALTQPPPHPTPPRERPPRSRSWEPVPRPEPRPAERALLLQGRPTVGKEKNCSPPRPSARQTRNSDAPQDTPRSSGGPAALGDSGSSAWQSRGHSDGKATAGRVSTGPGPLGVGAAAADCGAAANVNAASRGRQPSGPLPRLQGWQASPTTQGPQAPRGVGPKPPEPGDFSQDGNPDFSVKLTDL